MGGRLPTAWLCPLVALWARLRAADSQMFVLATGAQVTQLPKFGSG
jgi:hypothetical protein